MRSVCDLCRRLREERAGWTREERLFVWLNLIGAALFLLRHTVALPF